MKAEIDSLLADPNKKLPEKFSLIHYLKFIIPSLFGILFFLVPIQVVEDGTTKITIGMGVMADYLNDLVADYLPAYTVIIIGLSLVLTIFFKFFSKDTPKSPLMDIFKPEMGWFILRILGFLFALLTFLYSIPSASKWLTANTPWLGSSYFSWIYDRNTGGVMLFDLAPILITFFFFASILLPFLVEFGFMEFIGILVRRSFRKIFSLPGRSSIDAVASWLGSGTVGVMITAQQYEQGYYNKREAAVIATNFSIASIAFSLLVAKTIGISHLFIPFYLTILISGLIIAIILPRIPPLSLIKDEYLEGVGAKIQEDLPDGRSLFSWGTEQATIRAYHAPTFWRLTQISLINFIDISFALMPIVIAVGTIALALTEFTPIFEYLSYPFVPLLNLLNVPEATQAAPAMLVGFADMFLPAVIGKGIESEQTRFVVGCISMVQLIYLSEVGALILKSKIPIGIVQLFIIFVLRTVIALPIIVLMAHLLL